MAKNKITVMDLPKGNAVIPADEQKALLEILGQEGYLDDKTQESGEGVTMLTWRDLEDLTGRRDLPQKGSVALARLLGWSESHRKATVLLIIKG